MSDKNFGRRRRGGMRFRPMRGMQPPKKQEQRDAQQARAEALAEGNAAAENLFDQTRFQKEIERSENLAAGLPVLAWTVDDPGQARSLLRAGVAGLFANDPAGLRAACGLGPVYSS